MVPDQYSTLGSFFLDSLAFWLDTSYVIKFSSCRTDFIFTANCHGLGLHFSGYDKKPKPNLPNPTCSPAYSFHLFVALTFHINS